MRQLIESHGRSFGTTDSGRSWCLKALHPSDPVGEIEGIPDQTAKSVVFQTYTQVVDIAPPAGSAGSWEGEIYFFADPSCPVSWYTRDEDDSVHETGEASNATWGANANLASRAFVAAFESWRMAYAGLTVSLDATALTNKGNLVAAQYIPNPVDYGMISIDETGAHVPNSRVVMYQEADTAEYQQVNQMPNSYVGLAKDGCYIPLRLDGNHQKWWTPSDGLVFDSSGLVASGADTFTIPVADAGATGVGLYPNTDQFWYNPTTHLYMGQKHLLPCFANVGVVAFKNLDITAHLRLTYRLGVEGTVQPGTALTPYQHISPEYDREAIDTYFAIARRLKDAYPASYNDLGKMWDVIKQVAQALGPVVKSIPVYGPAITAVASTVGKQVDRAIARSRKRTPKKGTPPRK